MKFLWVLLFGAACLVTGGCYNNTYIKGCQTESAQSNEISPGAKGMAMESPKPTVISTTYQEVYTTEYTPTGPVVRKAIIPVYTNTSTVKETIMVPMAVVETTTTQPMSAQEVSSVTLLSSQPSLPVVPGFAPGQPVQPSVSEPTAYFGPTSAPVYSTQTSWF